MPDGTQVTLDMSTAQPIQANAVKLDMSTAKPIEGTEPKQSGFWDTLSREGKSFTGTIAGIPSAVYHAFSEPPMQDEKDRWGAEEVAGPKRVGLGLHRLITAPVETAGKWYSDAFSGKIPLAYEQALSVAPEAIGSAAGSVVAGKLAEGAPDAAKAVMDKAPEVGAQIVRGAVKGTNAVLSKAPGSIGAAAGTAVGSAIPVPGATMAGAGIGYALGKELLPSLKVPGEEFGLPKAVYPGAPLPESPPTYPGAPLPEHPGTFPGAPLPEAPPQELLQAGALAKGPAQPPPEAGALGTISPPAVAQPAAPEPQATAPSSIPSGGGIPRTLSGESALRQILTGQDNANLLKIAKSRGINVTAESQLKPGIADNKLITKIIDDFSDDELDGLRSQYMESKLNRHQFGNIGPEAWKTMSLQTYFHDLKIPASVLKRTQAAVAQPSPEDLTDILQKSLDAAKKRPQASQ